MSISRETAQSAYSEAKRLAEANSQADMISSAKLCLHYSKAFINEGRFELAVNWAKHSIKYSAGVFCPSYQALGDTLNREAPEFFTL